MNLYVLVLVGFVGAALMIILVIKYQYWKDHKEEERKNRQSIYLAEQKRSRDNIKRYNEALKKNDKLPHLN